ncbi:MAG: FliH/SctL family protein [Oscillospiraceae bacterium]|nr:FliH/SctL family protein [Oscillospiraceae bacterium]
MIKAGRARLVDPAAGEPRDGSGTGEAFPGEADRSDLQADGLRAAIEESRRAHEEELKAAYEELIAAAQDEAALRLEDARGEASGMISEARTQSGDIRREASETGYAEGMARAEEETREILRRAEADVKAVLEEAERERLRIAEETRPEMYRLALDIAEKILKYELNENHEAYMGILSGAIDRVRTEGTVTLHVNVAEFTRYFGGQEKARLRTAEGMISADVTADPSVEPGGCLIETDSGIVDASIGVQLEQIGQSLGLKEIE